MKLPMHPRKALITSPATAIMIQIVHGLVRKMLAKKRFVSSPITPGRNATCVFAHSGQRGPAGPRITHFVQIGRSHRPHRNTVSTFGWR
jgi:hypothetical protein